MQTWRAVIGRFRAAATNHKVIIKNYSYLSAFQVLNLILPMVTYPYLIRVLGTQPYGLLVFAQSIVSYLVVLVGFGFNVSASKEVSIHRADPAKLSEVVSCVYIVKGTLFLVSSAVLFVLLLCLPNMGEHAWLYAVTMYLCLEEFLFPMWYFQGIERMEYITVITLSSRLAFVGLIFAFVHKPDDYLLVPVLNGLAALLSGSSALYVVFRAHRVRFRFPALKTIRSYALDSLPIFLSNVSSVIYANTNKVVLGLFLGLREVAYYDLAEKLTGVLRTPILLIGQTIFPKIANERDKHFLRKISIYALALAMVIVAVGSLSAGIIVRLAGGAQMSDSIPVFRIILLSILPITVSLLFANINLLSWGFNKDYLTIRVSSNLMYVLCLGLLYVAGAISLYSLALLVLGVEILVAVLSVHYSSRRGINFFQAGAVND